MIGDVPLEVATAYNMLPEGVGNTSEGRTSVDNGTVRSMFVIDPHRKIKAMLTYPMSTGRNFDEVPRLLDACQISAEHGVSAPVNWRQGDDVVVPAAMPEEEVRAKFPKGLKTLKSYLRFGAQPKLA